VSNKYTRARRKKSDRPKKPYDDFPLTPHASGAWQKKIRGKVRYFGRWGRIKNGKMERLPGDGWEAALALYKAQADDLHAGRSPQVANRGELTVNDLCNNYLTSKLLLLQSGEITARTFKEYKQTCERLVVFFGGTRPVAGLEGIDFEKLRADIAKDWGPVRLTNEVVRIRSVFKYNRKADVVPDEFKKPKASTMRKHRTAAGKRLFTAQEIRWLLDGKTVEDEHGKTKQLAGAGTQLRAMILLAINCGYGNADVAELTQSVVDLSNGWIDFPRPKTGIDRRCPLWPETVSALKAALAARPDPNTKADKDFVFITAHGNRWSREEITWKGKGDERTIDTVTPLNAVGLEFGKVLKRLGINGRKGLGFYSLRHTFRTVADSTKDFVAARLVMGHADGSIDAVYREQIDDSRLLAVTGHVHNWLFGAVGGAK
jgi:integrase